MLTETISCPVCEGSTLQPLLRKDGWQIVKCGSCTLAMVNPRRTNAVTIYQNDAYFQDERYYYDYLGNKDAYQKGFRSKLKLIQRFGPKAGRLLDVGAAYGFFMEEANKFGYVPYGVELSPSAARHAGRYGEVFTGSLADHPADSRFSVITFIDSLEHFEEPLAGLRKAAALLEPNGIVAVMVPNIESLFARTLGARWHLLLPEEHLFYFSPQSTGKMLSKAGLELVHLGTGGYGRSLQELLQVVLRGHHAARFPGGGLLRRVSFEINLGDIFAIARKA